MATRAIVHYHNQNGYTTISLNEEEAEECYWDNEFYVSVPTNTGKKVIPISRVYEIEFFDNEDFDDIDND